MYLKEKWPINYFKLYFHWEIDIGSRYLSFNLDIGSNTFNDPDSSLTPFEVIICIKSFVSALNFQRIID